jgi:hypothetical protein
MLRPFSSGRDSLIAATSKVGVASVAIIGIKGGLGMGHSVEEWNGPE